jgi:glycyl-tRNA synthetase
VDRSDWQQILSAYARCVRITRDQEAVFTMDADAFQEPAEKGLCQSLLAMESAPRRPGSVDDLMNAFTPQIPAINAFFDQVMVMSEDKKVRENRLGMLQRIAAFTSSVADFSLLEGF